MSTFSNESPSFRRRSNLSSASTASSTSHTPVPSPKSRRIITSKRPEIPISTSPEDLIPPRHERTLQSRLREVRIFLGDFLITLHYPETKRKFRKVFLLMGISLMLVLLIPSSTIIFGGEKAALYFKKKHDMIWSAMEAQYGEIDKRVKEERETMHWIKQWPRDTTNNRIISRELSPPDEILAGLQDVYVINALEYAYEDTQYTINHIKLSIPDLSVAGFQLGQELRKFQQWIFEFSSDLAAFRREIVKALEDLKWENGLLDGTLHGTMPQATWQRQYDPNSKEGRMIAEMWIAHFGNLKTKIDEIWKKTNYLDNRIDHTVRRRVILEELSNSTQLDMAKEAKKRGWDNSYNAVMAQDLFKRFGQNKTEGLEESLRSCTHGIRILLQDARGYIEGIMEKLQRVRQRTTREYLNAYAYGEANEQPPIVEIPTVEEQIISIHMISDKYEVAIAFMNDMVSKLHSTVARKSSDSEERRRFLDYIISKGSSGK